MSNVLDLEVPQRTDLREPEDLAGWLKEAFPGIRDVQMRPARYGGVTRAAMSGLFCATMLEVFVTAQGAPRARVVGICPLCPTLVEHVGARTPVRMSQCVTVFLPAPALAGEIDFYRAYGCWPVDAATGPVGFGTDQCGTHPTPVR